MPVEPHQPVSPVTFTVVDPLPGEGGGGGGGPIGSPLGKPADGPLPADRDGVVGVPPHHADASAQQTSSVEPSLRGAPGNIDIL